MFDAIDDLGRWSRENTESDNLRHQLDFYEIHQKWAPDTVDKMTVHDARRQVAKFDRYNEYTDNARKQAEQQAALDAKG